MGLNPPPQSQQNEGVKDCNEGNLNAAIRWLGVDAIKAEFPTTLITKRGGQSWPLVQPAPARQPISIIVFNDSGRGSDPDGTDCTSESSIYLGPSLLSWRSKKQWDRLNLANSGAIILWVQSLLTELKTPFQTQITFCDNSGTVSPYHTVQCSSSGTRHLCAREGSKPELHSSPYSYYWSDCWFPHKASLWTVVHLLFQTNLRCLTSLRLLNHLEFEGTSLGCSLILVVVCRSYLASVPFRRHISHMSNCYWQNSGIIG